jgi:hypothetical protein
MDIFIDNVVFKIENISENIQGNENLPLNSMHYSDCIDEADDLDFLSALCQSTSKTNLKRLWVLPKINLHKVS